MKKETNTPKHKHLQHIFGAIALGLIGFALVTALGISSLALNTQKAAMQELNREMPTLSGEAAIEYLKRD